MIEKLVTLIEKSKGEGILRGGTINPHIQEAEKVIIKKTRPGRIYRFEELLGLVNDDGQFKEQYPDGNGFSNEMAVEIAIGSSRLFIPTKGLYGGMPAYKRMKKKPGHA